MNIELSQFCKSCNRSTHERVVIKIPTSQRSTCQVCGAYKMKQNITREYVMEKCKITSQDAVIIGGIKPDSMMALRWPCGRGTGIYLNYPQIVDAPDEIITDAINKLVDVTFKHMPRCKKGCNETKS